MIKANPSPNRRLIWVALAGMLVSVAALSELKSIRDDLRLKERLAEREAYENRDVVEWVRIDDVRYDGVELCITGRLKKRGCRLASTNPRDVVRFDRMEKSTGLLHPVDFTFPSDRGEEEDGLTRDRSRPPGVSGIDGWCFVLPWVEQHDDPVVGFASHLCGERLIGPREFMRFVPSDLLDPEGREGLE